MLGCRTENGRVPPITRKADYKDDDHDHDDDHNHDHDDDHNHENEHDHNHENEHDHEHEHDNECDITLNGYRVSTLGTAIKSDAP